jgi:hypothetical protein
MADDRARTAVETLRNAGSTARKAKSTVANAMSFHRADGLHIAKTTLAAVLAWAGARWLTMADAAVWMGPATAVIVVQATLYRTLANGIRRVGAVTAGVMIAGLVGRLLGLNAISLLLIVPSALLAARWRRIGDRGADIVTTAVLMLSYGATAAHEQYLRDYVIQTAMGALAGVVVNFAIPPPLQVRRSYSLMLDLTQDTAKLLCRIGDGLRDGCEEADVRDWQGEVDGLDGQLGDTADAIQRGAESRRFNPRRWRSPVPAPHTYRPLLRTMRLIMPSVSSIVRAIGHAATEDERAPEALISETFAHSYAGLLAATAEAIAAQGRNPADSDPRARQQVTASLEKAAAIQERMTRLVENGELSRPRGWAVSGSLLIDAERILSNLTWCADALEQRRPASSSPSRPSAD